MTELYPIGQKELVGDSQVYYAWYYSKDAEGNSKKFYAWVVERYGQSHFFGDRIRAQVYALTGIRVEGPFSSRGPLPVTGIKVKFQKMMNGLKRKLT